MLVTGYVYGMGGVEIGVKVTLIDPDTGQIQTIVLAPGERYTVEGVQAQIEPFVIRFESYGYEPFETTVGALIRTGTTVTLPKTNNLVPVAVLAGIIVLVWVKKKK